MSSVERRVDGLALAVGLGSPVPTETLRKCFRGTIAFPAVSQYLQGVGPYFRPKVQGVAQKRVQGRKEARETWVRASGD